MKVSTMLATVAGGALGAGAGVAAAGIVDFVAWVAVETATSSASYGGHMPPPRSEEPSIELFNWIGKVAVVSVPVGASLGGTLGGTAEVVLRKVATFVYERLELREGLRQIGPNIGEDW